MSRTTPISHLMTSRVRSLGIDAKLSEVRQLLKRENFHHVPIVDGERLVGIVSSRDLIRVLRDAEPDASLGVDEQLDLSSTVGRVMSRDLVTVLADESVELAIDLIADGRIHSVLVVDESERLVGIVTDADLLDYLDA
jgi:CBS domain-containing protein